jgi:hypothetical protein
MNIRTRGVQAGQKIVEMWGMASGKLVNNRFKFNTL